MHVVIGLLCAFLAAYIVYGLLPIPRSYWSRRLETITSNGEDTPPLPFGRAMLYGVGRATMRFAPARWVFGARQQLWWAQQNGEWSGWTEVDFWGLRVVLAALGAALGMSLGGMIHAAIIGLIAFVFPGMRLGSAAEMAQRRFLRELPEVVQALSLLVATGASLTEALRRVAEGEGLVSRWIAATLAQATGRGLFTPLTSIGQQEAEPGVLRRRATESGLPELVTLATQLDMIQQKGVGAQELLNSLADAVARDYQAAVARRAEALGSKLVLPVFLFFFIPYLVALLAPAMAGVLWFLTGR